MNAFYMRFASVCLVLLVVLSASVQCAAAFLQIKSISHSCTNTAYKSNLAHRVEFQANSAKANNDDEDVVDKGETPIFAQSKVKINDHGSDLTDRFKYQVNALMGNYDPVASETDNEYTNGNILNAFLNFPTTYVFNVVGKTKGDKNLAEEYINKVKHIIQSNTGDVECILCSKSRGNNFTKVEVEATVQSSSMIARIYEELADLDESSMMF
jgi:putative lipoic acid-binding regulatory protein